ncbi:uncharacterized protein F4822DRAFT_403089 [Hypoxylon trugodes]|uniref:uncharacterized protein n=1 Tax=Hypoxylon trugodes TaxID=326681 RepID=UPI002196C327|nr:uncharacterized protein F4822DRAFT_403089 [Hypoxylon trugodes]KAI1388530.1 hypothetical protein F4822DRAFT_403089 [Hypoxylon trugodes]
MAKETNGKDYAVCDPCRAKKIRCDRDKPSCANCVRIGQRCEWSGQGKKCNQTALLSHTIDSLGSRLLNLEVYESYFSEVVPDKKPYMSV